MNIMITYLIITNLAIAGAIILLFWQSWLPMFRPDWFIVYNIYKNNMFNYDKKLIFLKVKGYKKEYKFNEKIYSHHGIKPYIDNNGVYNWNFKEDGYKPIKFTVDTVNIDSKLVAETKNISLDDIWFSGDGLTDFIAKYGVIILAFLIIVLFFYLINQNQQTTRILINATSRLR